MMKPLPLDSKEIQSLRFRTIVIATVIALIFSLLASRLWYLQILNGEKYAQYSQGNRIRLVPQAAPRGVIYDRHGVTLADNRPAYQLQLIREDTPDLEKTLRNLSKAINIPYVAFLKTLEDHRHQAPFKPIILEEDLEYKKAMIVETYQEDFPGISIVLQSQRFYPHNKIAAHILGYVGMRNEQQARELPKNKLSSGQIVGQSSLEKRYNDTLIGTDGGKQIEVDHVGRELRVLNQAINPIPGQDVYLTIDTRLQRFIYEIMREKSGAVVVMRPKTGEILGMGSFPNFNPNLFAAGMSQKHWNRLVQNPDHPLENKAIQGTYPPGSTFKLAVAYAGLDQKIIDNETTYLCNGYYHLPKREAPYKCWKHSSGGHGEVNLRKALKESCNVFFYHLAVELGIDRLHEYGNRFGFGQKTGIQLPDEKSGVMPSRAWKEKTFGKPWYPGDTPPIGIGQGFVTATPLQVLNFVNILANGGLEVRPYLILNEALPPYQNLGLSEQYLQWIREGMSAAVNENLGTAEVIRSNLLEFAAKTGTAQVVGHETTKNWAEAKKKLKEFQNHAWFVAFGPVENPEISVVVLVEHGGAGAKAAGPVAKKILDYYLEHFYDQSHSATPPKRPQTLLAQRLQAAFH